MKLSNKIQELSLFQTNSDRVTIESSTILIGADLVLAMHIHSLNRRRSERRCALLAALMERDKTMEQSFIEPDLRHIY